VTHESAPPLPFVGFRPDVQGLRAVAVIIVLLFHANAPFLPGGFVGVDVFFVISGYLITGLLLREALAHGRISLAGFYARRARRILPAATVVLIATLLLTVAFLPQIRWRSIGTEAATAAVYVVNWVLAGGTDYMNPDVMASPLQHFWTLSVEEQFYIVWPLVLIAVLAITARTASRRASKNVDAGRLLRFAGIGILAIFIPSLAWSIHYTTINPAPAYFITTTRLWELALGAMVAVFAPLLARLPNFAAQALGWAGLGGILLASVWYTAKEPAFPGTAALLPTLASAAIIVAGMSGRAETGVGRLLSLRPMRWVGDLSYSLYLWHWPLIVVATYLLGGTLGFGWGLAITALSFVPSWLSYRFIENPFRDWPRLKLSASHALAAGSGLVAASAAIAGLVILLPNAVAGADPVASAITPRAIDARDDNSELYREGCQLETEESTPKECVFGDTKSNTTVALAGDSHAAALMPALDTIAKRNGWRLVTYTKSACSFATIPQTHAGREFPQCDEWTDEAFTDVMTERPDLLVTVNAGRRGVWDDGKALKGTDRYQAFEQTLRSDWQELNEAGIPVVAIADTPEMGIDVPECVSANPSDLEACAVPKEQAVDNRPHPEVDAAEGLPQTEVLDINHLLCPDDTCPAVIDDVLVWRDNQHLTATFSETLATPLEKELDQLSIAPVAQPSMP